LPPAQGRSYDLKVGFKVENDKIAIIETVHCREHGKKKTEFICSFISLEAGQAMAR
jgi:hypothetical protein